ncbi:hypothetical protein, partial [Sinorhizobium saheli]|uniref:hypothetical protein n=1 Tax=Sinorhizobium saheli TaxID=36856 RepID=UPI001AEEA798
ITAKTQKPEGFFSSLLAPPPGAGSGSPRIFSFPLPTELPKPESVLRLESAAIQSATATFARLIRRAAL